jgi:hypothetical protein
MKNLTKAYAPMSIRFVLLMRHAAPDKISGQTLEVAQGLRTYIDETNSVSSLRLDLGRCFRPMRGAAARTAEILGTMLPLRTEHLPVDGIDALDPDASIANPYIGRVRGKRRRQIRQQRALLERILNKNVQSEENAVMIVGHSPQTDWLLHELVRPRFLLRLAYYRHSFASAEILCVDRRPQLWGIIPRQGRVIWSLAPTDRETELLLRDKIKGKMESAKLLGSIVGAGAGLVLAGFHELAFGWPKTMDDLARLVRRPQVPDLDDERLAFFGASILLLMVASGLYWSAYLSYDRLLMPTRFWSAAKPPRPRWRGVVWRPPSSSLLIMYQNMQRVWFRAFIPATFSTGLALVCLVYAAIIQQMVDAFRDASIARWLFFVGAFLLAVIIAIGHCRARPMLGAQD